MRTTKQGYIGVAINCNEMTEFPKTQMMFGQPKLDV